LLIQGAAVMAALVYSGVMSFVLLKLINLVVPIRAAMTDEMEGLDVTQHGEEAYIHDGGLTVAARGETPATTPGMVAAPAASTY
jgi:Amt family ammonium transporter